MKLRILHRTSAVLVGAFAFVHVVNHLLSLAGVEYHLAFMRAARIVYREPIIEFALLLCVAFQVVSGLLLVIRGWRNRKGFVAWLQAVSGAALAFFMLVHVGSVLFGRTVLNLDTNFYFAAAGFHVAPYQLFFAPYYFLAVLALFTHVGCAAYWNLPPSSQRVRIAVVALPMLMGGTLSLLIVLSLAGKLEPVEVPAKYKVTYGRTGG